MAKLYFNTVFLALIFLTEFSFASESCTVKSEAQKSQLGLSDLKCSMHQLKPECIQVAESDPSVAQYLSCGPSDFERPIGEISSTCVSQFVQPTIDTFKMVAGAVASSVRKSFSDRKQFVEECKNDADLSFQTCP